MNRSDKQLDTRQTRVLPTYNACWFSIHYASGYIARNMLDSVKASTPDGAAEELTQAWIHPAPPFHLDYPSYIVFEAFEEEEAEYVNR